MAAKWLLPGNYLVFLLLVAGVLGILAYLFVNILEQSFTTGQFWNAIIALGYIAVTLLLSVFIYFTRLARDRIWIHQLPRDYTLSARDTPAKMMRLIEGCFSTCLEKFDAQFVHQHIDHLGAQNPKASQRLSVPYITIIESMPSLFEDHILTFYPRFRRKPHISLRTYLSDAVDIGVFNPAAAVHVYSYIDRYEAARFSGRMLSETEFFELFTTCIALLRSVSIPAADHSVTDTSSELSDDAGSVIIRDSRRPSWFSSAVSGGSDEEMLYQYLAPRRASAHRASSSGVSLEPPLQPLSRLDSATSDNSVGTMLHHEI